MRRSIAIGLALMAFPAFAQAPNPAPPPPAAPTAPAPVPPPVAGTPADPNLAVASVKLEGGFRASKLIGASVYNDQKEKIGSLDDLIVKNDKQIVMAIVSVGGFLGIGNKLVAIPYDQIRVDLANVETPVLLPGATKDNLSAMSTFTYNG